MNEAQGWDPILAHETSVVEVQVVRVRSLEDPFRLLGVDPDADEGQVKKAYRKLALRYHPDVNKDELAEAKFKALREAYDLLLGKGSDSSNNTKAAPFGGNWDMHDWYWTFGMRKRQRRQNPATAPQHSAAAAQKHKPQVHSQLTNLKRRAARRRARGSEPFAAESAAAASAPTAVPVSVPTTAAAPIQARSAAAFSQAPATAASSSGAEGAFHAEAPHAASPATAYGHPAATGSDDDAVDAGVSSSAPPSRPVASTSGHSAAISRLSALLGIPDLLESSVAAVHTALDRHHNCVRACMAWGSLDGGEHAHAPQWPHKWTPTLWSGRHREQPAPPQVTVEPLMSALTATGMRRYGHSSRRNKGWPGNHALSSSSHCSHEGSAQEAGTMSARTGSGSSLRGAGINKGRAAAASADSRQGDKQVVSTQVVPQATSAGDEERRGGCEGQAEFPRRRFAASEERRSAVKGQLAGLRRRSALKKKM